MRKKSAIFIITFIATFFLVSVAWAASSNNGSAQPPAQEEHQGCLTCHDGIENIVDPESDMGKQINTQGECTVCHGGNARVVKIESEEGEETEEDEEAIAAVLEEAHGPEGKFYPDPGSPWIVAKTCGRCHINYGYAMSLSLMNTEAGKIQGNLWAWGVQGQYAEGRTVKYANYTLDDTDGPTPIFGSDTYKAYMEALIAAYPDQMPSHVDMLPEPTVEEIIADPSLAAFTYQRNQCQRCHVGVPGRDKRGDYRGMGCSACHIPYSNNGFYEGNDPTIPTDDPGHMLVHEIQGTEEKRNGIPVETCNSCHNRGKRIGVSFEGIMEFPYGTPFFEDGSKQDGDTRLHTKSYLYIKDDLHHDPISRDGNPEGGMLCQDCHTSIEMHGDGNLFGTTLAQVEIECSDCHGTPDNFPWELPLGYGEELLAPVSDEARGTSDKLPIELAFGTRYDVEDGYLLTARGNPFGNVVRRGDDVILHSATGNKFTIPTLKSIKMAGSWSSPEAEVAMDKVTAHQDSLECYACHADWAPQCYGCHVVADYSEEKTGTDWVAIGNTQNPDGTVDMSLTTPGSISEGRSFLRWEAPVLGVNGEGRVTPLIPGCQVIFTVIGPDGSTVAHNQIGYTAPNEEGGGPEGQRGIDMAPAQPHTTGRQARTCESCHSNSKALGYGLENGRFLQGYDDGLVVDLRDADGNIIPSSYEQQIFAIPDLPMDLTQIIDPETGEQVQTVGSHWPDSGPLSADQRTRMERVGICMGCHQNMADTEFWTDEVVARYGEIVSGDDHISMMNQLVRDAVTGKAAMTEVEVAQAEVESLQEDLDAARASLANIETPHAEEGSASTAEASPATSNTARNSVIALVIGLVIGIGLMVVRAKK